MAKKTRGQGWELIRAGGSSGPQKRGQSEAPDKQRIKIREEKRNKGKMVTVASGFKLTDKDLKALAKRLKSTCGSGGTARPESNAVEVQGQHTQKVRESLESEGFKVV